MDKRITHSVAGSGKTTRIVNSIDQNSRTLVLTYTHANLENIKRKIIEKFGQIPDKVRVSPFTSFLYSSCFRPLLHDFLNERGLSFKPPEKGFPKKSEARYYLNSKRYAYHCRLGLALIELGQVDDLLARLQRYYDHIFIDEFQDLSSRDFDFITLLGRSKIKLDLVGDFYQHTYPSSLDGNYKSNLFENKDEYLELLYQAGYTLHPEQLTKSHRCSPTVCRFVSDNLGIAIESHRSDETNIEYVDSENKYQELAKDDSIVKLYYKDHQSNGCFSRNWGECKGEDSYSSVCVVFNKTTDALYKKGSLIDLAPLSKNKLYVACTRARKDLFLVSSARK